MIAAIALFLLGRLTQVGWLYLVDAVLWGIIMLSAIFPWLGVAFIAAHRRVDSTESGKAQPVPAEGDTVRISVSLGSRALWPSYLLNVFYDCSLASPENRLLRFFVSNVFRSGQVDIETTVEAFQRGLHKLGPLVVESSAPFGLFRRRRNVTGEQPVLVYPQVLPMRHLAMAQGFSGMESQGRRGRTGTDLAGTRNYVPGDPRRSIHWRNSAKTGQLMVKELEDPLDRTTYLLFDATQVWGEDRETTLEYGIKVVASVGSFAQCNHLPIQVLGGGLSKRANPVPKAVMQSEIKGPASRPLLWSTLMKELAMVQPGDGYEIGENLAKVPPGASLVAVISASDSGGLQALAKASTMLQSVVLISLEGFIEHEPERGTKEEMHADDLRSLVSAKILVIPCRPGQLKQALEALERGKGEARSKSITDSMPLVNQAVAVDGQNGNAHYGG